MINDFRRFDPNQSDGVGVPAGNDSCAVSADDFYLLYHHMLNGIAYCRMLFRDGQPEDILYLATNPAFETQTGLKNVAGKRVSEVIPDMRSADLELFNICARVARGGQPESFEIFVKSLQMWFSISVYCPRPEHFVAVFDVITERKRAEEAMRIASLVYRHSSDAMIITNADNEIIAVNDAFTALMGYTEAAVLGKSPSLFQSGLQHEEFYRGMWAAIIASGHWEGDLQDRKKNGDLIDVRLVVNTLFDNGGKVVQRVALFSDITEKKRAELQIWEHANIDTLTRLPNRHQFQERLRQHIERAGQAGTTLALLLIDLDQFKEVNDTLGHYKGDNLLIAVAHRIAECVRESVALSRLGGDEFSIILSDPGDLANVAAIARHIIDTLRKPFALDADKVFISASVGIALFPDDGADVQHLLRHADQAMYAAKNAGRNRSCYFTRSLQDIAQARMSLTNDLREALAGKQFEVHYQPIVELASGDIRKAEALIRWNHPARGLVSPVDFIPLAEASGLILDIGKWVFMQAADQVLRMRAMGMPTFQISVNVSPVQFRNGGALSLLWPKHLAALGLPPQSMVIEITEGLLLDLNPEVKDTLIAFGAAGVQVALDDFGTGYSSLAYLKKFDIDYLKIDRAFVSNLEADPNDRALCEAIIVMAHKLGLRVIAEGVETAAQRDLLAAAGCDFAQGYLYSRPLPASRFEEFFRR